MPTLQARAVRRAAEVLGDNQLAARLGVTEIQLRFWIQGAVEPPGDVFLKVADILCDLALDDMKRQRRVNPKPDGDIA